MGNDATRSSARSIARCLGVLTVVATSSCSLLLLGEDFTGGNSNGTDARDASSTPDASDAEGASDASNAEDTPDAAVELLDNPGFEAGGAECGPGWDETSSSLQRISEGRTGSACRVCRVSTGTNWFEVVRRFRPGLGPGSYRLEGWYRGDGNASGCELGIDLTTADGGWRQLTTTSCEPSRSGWQHLVMTASIGEGETLDRAYAAAHAASGVCFDVDSLSLTK